MRRDPEPDAKRASAPFLLVEMDADHAKATAFNMLFMIWRRTLNVAYRRGMLIVRDLATQFPEGVGVFQIVEVDAVPPDAETRNSFVDFLKLDHVKHFSVTHDGVGFKAAAVRAITTGVHLLARPTCKHSVHSSIAEAAGWCAVAQSNLGRHESPQQIENIVRGLRELHRTRYPR